MSDIPAADVKKLRDRTGISFAKCKEALVKANGDIEKAIELIRISSKGDAIKVGGRETAEGRIAVHVEPARRAGAILELRCESAPVAKSELFVTLANDLARQAAIEGAENPDELLVQRFLDDPAKTVNDRIHETIGLIRENMKPARLTRLFGGHMNSYVHHDGSIGVLLQVEGAQADPQLLRDVCMHIAAKSPVAALREHIPAATIAKETEIARAQAAEQGKGKPANILDKIAEGKLRTWFAENVLVEQPFVKDDTKTVGALLQGAGLKLVRFVRYKVGEVE
jgi:elongation factor Ts